MVSGALGTLRQLQNRVGEDQQPSVVHTGFVGRPSFDIPQEQVRELVENGFTGPQMAGIVGVSLSTIRRRIRQFGGLSGLREYDAISDSDLDIIVQEIKQSTVLSYISVPCRWTLVWNSAPLVLRYVTENGVFLCRSLWKKCVRNVEGLCLF